MLVAKASSILSATGPSAGERQVIKMTGTILVGDSLTMLKTLPDQSVHMVCTSPPY